MSVKVDRGRVEREEYRESRVVRSEYWLVREELGMTSGSRRCHRQI